MLAEIHLTGKIPSLKNSRINTRSGKSFPSKEFSEWFQYAQLKIRQAWKDDPVTYPVSVNIRAYGYRNDADNLAGSILEAMQGLVYENDRQVERLSVNVDRLPKTKNCYIEIIRLESE